jgi:hypothetical protein
MAEATVAAKPLKKRRGRRRDPESRAALGMRRSRERRKRGFVSVAIDLHATEVQALTKFGLLLPEEIKSQPAVRRAVNMFIDKYRPFTTIDPRPRFHSAADRVPWVPADSKLTRPSD